MKKILVTGAAGMIGSHFSEELIKRNYGVIGLDNLSFGKKDNIAEFYNNENFTFLTADVLDYGVIEELAGGVDIIVHLAALKKPYEKDPTNLTLRVNAEGTKNVLEAALKYKIKVVFASTSDVYGSSNDFPFKETSDSVIGSSSIPRWSYAVSKLYAEHLVFSYYRDYGVPVVILRYFGCFSSRSNASWSGGHVPIFINAVLNDEEIIIHGDGRQTRSMALVNDVVEGTLLAMENDNARGGMFNIGSDEEWSIIDTAYLIHKLADTGKEIKLKFKPISEIFGDYKEIMRRAPDISKAKNVLGFSPKVSFEEALRRTIDSRKKERGLLAKDGLDGGRQNKN